MRYPYLLFIIFPFYFSFCKNYLPSETHPSEAIQIYKIDSIRLPVNGVTHFLNISPFNHDLLVFMANSGKVHIVDTGGTLKNSFQVTESDYKHIGASLFFGDFLENHTIVLCSNKGYTEYDYSGEQLKNVKVKNLLSASSGQCDVIEIDHARWLIHNPIEDIEGVLNTKKFDLASREFHKVKNLTAYNYSDGLSADFAPPTFG